MEDLKKKMLIGGVVGGVLGGAISMVRERFESSGAVGGSSLARDIADLEYEATKYRLIDSSDSRTLSRLAAQVRSGRRVSSSLRMESEASFDRIRRSASARNLYSFSQDAKRISAHLSDYNRTAS